MPKWRTVSFVPGVTLNIEDSTSVEPTAKPYDIFPHGPSEYDLQSKENTSISKFISAYTE